MPEDDAGRDPIGQDVRLSTLDARLRAASSAEKARTGSAQRGPERGYRQGTRVLTELVAAPAGGALLGWVLDRLFGTSPWFLLGMLMLGIGVAFRNIIVISRQRPE